jgi:hypothetical protein
MDIRLIFRTSQLSFDDGETQKDKQVVIWLWRSMRVSWRREANPPELNSEAQSKPVWV